MAPLCKCRCSTPTGRACDNNNNNVAGGEGGEGGMKRSRRRRTKQASSYARGKSSKGGNNYREQTNGSSSGTCAGCSPSPRLGTVPCAFLASFVVMQLVHAQLPSQRPACVFKSPLELLLWSLKTCSVGRAGIRSGLTPTNSAGQK